MSFSKDDAEFKTEEFRATDMGGESSPPEFTLPEIPSGGIDIGTIAPVFGVDAPASPYGNQEADYLDYNIKGRSYGERLMFNTGSAYLGGIVGGGIYGFFEGLRTSPSPKFKIRLNTVLNACGKRGSRAGNALGSLAMIYSSFEALEDQLDMDQYVGGYYQLIPVTAAAMTGIFYKSTAGPRAMALAGVLGAGSMAAATAAATAADFKV